MPNLIQRPPRPDRRAPARRRSGIQLTDLLWALIGLILTIGGTFIKASIAGIPMLSDPNQIPVHFLGTTYQIGAVLLTGCLGGSNAAVMSQIAYLTLGLVGVPVFSQGGGMHYVKQPVFGYLLGFIPGAWVCGRLAFRRSPRLESLGWSSLAGLLTIHLVGIAYLLLGYGFQWLETGALALPKALLIYSVSLLPGQFSVLCAIVVVAFIIRRLMFY